MPPIQSPPCPPAHPLIQAACDKLGAQEPAFITRAIQRCHPYHVCLLNHRGAGDLEQGLEMSFTQVIQSGSSGAFFWGASSQLYIQFNNIGLSSWPLTNVDDASHGNFATSFPTQVSSFVHFTRHGPVARGSILTFDFKVMNLYPGGSYYYPNTMNFGFFPNHQVSARAGSQDL